MAAHLPPPPPEQNYLEKLDVFKIKGRDKQGRRILRITGKFFPGFLSLSHILCIFSFLCSATVFLLFSSRSDYWYTLVLIGTVFCAQEVFECFALICWDSIFLLCSASILKVCLDSVFLLVSIELNFRPQVVCGIALLCTDSILIYLLFLDRRNWNWNWTVFEMYLYICTERYRCYALILSSWCFKQWDWIVVVVIIVV